MIKATPNTPSTSSEKSAPDTADGPLVASSESVEPPESFDVATVGGIGTECEGGERKRKKSKKHKRHNSKDGGHRHRISSFDLHRSVSLNDYYQPTKLVIRQRSGDLTGSSTAQLFVDTMEPPSPSPPPLLVPYQLPSNGFPTGDSPLADVLAQQKPAPTSVASISGQPFDSQSKMLSSSTASPASMGILLLIVFQ
uniref:Mediator complex subunit 19 n=1 Tax=Mesocestoides corti TaxID=53468 RepID=A0A5K3FX62_MESCO